MTFSPRTIFLGVFLLMGTAPTPVSSATTYSLSYDGGDPATASTGMAENLAVYAPGMAPGGWFGAVGPIWLTAAGNDGTTQTVLTWSLRVPGSLVADAPYTLITGDVPGLEPTKAGQIATLLANGQVLVHDAASGAALQAAVWEVVYEAGTSGYNVSTGAFQILGYGGPVDTAVVAAANLFLAHLDSGDWGPSPLLQTWQFVSQWGDDRRLFVTVSATTLDDLDIPEPGALMLLGSGVIALLGLGYHFGHRIPASTGRRGAGTVPGPDA